MSRLGGPGGNRARVARGGRWRGAASAAIMGIAVTAWMSAAGCYERVVGAKGMGATNVDIEEPYQEDTMLDRWIFGSSQPKGDSQKR